MEALDGLKAFSFSALPEELLQIVGARLSSGELRNARLVCTGWAKALAHCMPAVTVALPRQTTDGIFRQPLVLCSSGVLNSAQSQDYNAVPRSHPHHSSLGRRRSCRHSQDGTCSSSSCKRLCTSSTCCNGHPAAAGRQAVVSSSSNVQQEASSSGTVAAETAADAAEAAEAALVSRDKPSPFATEMNQAVLDCLLQDPLLTATAAAAEAAPAASSKGPSASAVAAAAGSGIPRLPRMSAIKAAISMPPSMAEQAAVTHQQQAMQQDPNQMRKLSSVPASNAHPVPRTRHVTKPGAAATQGDTAPPGPHHVVTTVGPVIQGWSSLPVAGLRTCSSLKQLNLKLSGAPPSPEDLLDLSKLLHLTHLSFKQVDGPDSDTLQHSTVQEDSAELGGSSTEHSRSTSGAVSSMQLTPSASVPAAVGPNSCTCAAAESAGCTGSGLKRSHTIGPMRMQASRSGLRSELGSATSAAANALERCHISSPDATAAVVFSSDGKPGDGVGPWGLSPMQVCAVHVCSSDEEADGDDADISSGSDQCDQCLADDADTAAAAAAAAQDYTRDQGYALGGDVSNHSNHSISCSVITPQHVKALAQLPYLSSLELAPKHGVWDAASREGLLHLNQLTGLTKLSITWGDAAAAGAPLGNEDAAAAAQEDQLPLQKCLARLTSLQELSISGAAVVDVAVLQRLQQLRSLVAEGLQVVNSDVMAIITEGEEQLRDQQQAAQHAAAGQGAHLAAQPVLSTAAPAAHQTGRWASLPHLAYIHAVHPASDISLLLQSTLTPQLNHLGFVTRGPSDFARLLGQHGKLRTLHLAFAEEESWHPIAVVRLPTALPSLTSLTIDGSFWLPNALIVALGAMDVPIEHLSLTCKLAPPCLQRLQYLKKLKRLALHHVPSPPSAKGVQDAMLQLPAKLLPAQLQELEISNGWILH